MEAQGTGVHIVMSAKTALDLGAPIRGILAFTSTATYDLRPPIHTNISGD